MKTNKLLVICSAMSLICLAACEGNNVSSSSSAQHEHAYEAVVTEPTHTAAGHTTYTCECGDTYTADEVAALGHTYESVVTAPTHTAAGYTTYTCSCGDTYTEAGEAALGHTYESVVTAPTHAEAGYTTYTCVCGDTYTEAGEAALGHKFIDGSCSCGEEFVAPKGGWALTTEINDGDKVLIGAPAYGKLLSAEKVSAGSYYNKGVDYSASDFTNVTDAEIFVVTANTDGSYTFTSETGVVIALADSYSSLNDTGVNKSWALEEKSEGIFYLKNTGRGNYLEWYASKDNWSTYATSSLSDLFELSFYGEAEAEDAEHIHNHISSVQAPTCEEAGYTSFTCRCGDTYTEAGAESVGHSFENGTCGTCGAQDPNYVAPVTAQTVDFNTIVTTNANGDSSYTKSFTTASGWVSNYSAIQTGGTTVMNPQFPVVGPDNTHKAVCLNGKTTAAGTLTSPTLTGGLTQISIDYTKIFTDTLLSVTVTVTEISSGTQYTHVISAELPKDEKYVVYSDVWTLETPVTGDFTIEVKNNCPSNSTSNKDRFTILKLEWQ